MAGTGRASAMAKGRYFILFFTVFLLSEAGLVSLLSGLV
jgi:hypothetical protein